MKKQTISSLTKKISSGWHHFNIRQRIHRDFEPFPHPKKLIRFIDKAIFFVGIAGPIMTLPQLNKIWIERNATGVSLVSWTAYALISLCWLTYGIVHDVKPIIVTYAAWFLIESTIVIGIIKFG